MQYEIQEVLNTICLIKRDSKGRLLGTLKEFEFTNLEEKVQAQNNAAKIIIQLIESKN